MDGVKINTLNLGSICVSCVPDPSWNWPCFSFPSLRALMIRRSCGKGEPWKCDAATKSPTRTASVRRHLGTSLAKYTLRKAVSSKKPRHDQSKHQGKTRHSNASYPIRPLPQTSLPPRSTQRPPRHSLTHRPFNNKTHPNTILMPPPPLHKVPNLSMVAELLVGLHDAFRLREGKALLRALEQPVDAVVDCCVD